VEPYCPPAAEGRNGKQCKEQYSLTPFLCLYITSPKEERADTDEQRLFDLKIHFYSKLHKALKELNRAFKRSLKKEVKEVNPNVFYRFEDMVEQKFKEVPKLDKEFSNCSNSKAAPCRAEERPCSNYFTTARSRRTRRRIASTLRRPRRSSERSSSLPNYKRKTKKSGNVLEQDLFTLIIYHRIRKCNSEDEKSGDSSFMIQGDLDTPRTWW
jgi:hypothetical protein